MCAHRGSAGRAHARARARAGRRAAAVAGPLNASHHSPRLLRRPRRERRRARPLTTSRPATNGAPPPATGLPPDSRRYKSAYELGGELRATATLRRHFAEQKAAEQPPGGGGAEGETGGAPAADAPASADGAAALPQPQTRGVPAAASAAPPFGAAGTKVAAAAAATTAGASGSAERFVPIAPLPLEQRKSGQWLLAGSAAWEDVRRRAARTRARSSFLPASLQNSGRCIPRSPCAPFAALLLRGSRLCGRAWARGAALRAHPPAISNSQH